MEQGNVDQANSIAYVGLIILGAVLLFTTFLTGDVGQKISINHNFEVNADTIYTEESRWYYNADSARSNIRIALFKERALHPYDVVYLAPDDYVDLKLKEGYNIVYLNTLGKEYPRLQKKFKILQLKPVEDSSNYYSKPITE